MKFNFKTLAAFISLSALMTGCSNDAGNGSSPLLDTSGKTTVSADNSKDSASAPAEKNEGLTSPSAENVTCSVKLSDSGITVNGSGAKVSGKTVNIPPKRVIFALSFEPRCKVNPNGFINQMLLVHLD